MQPRWLLAPYGLIMAVAVVWYLWTSGSPGSVCLLGAGSAAAIGVGLHRYRPRRATSWFLIGLALLLNAIAWVLYDALPGLPGVKSNAWIVWLLHLLMLLALMSGVLGLARSAVRGATAVIDTAIIALGAGLLLGVLVAIPYATSPDVTHLSPWVRVAYVVRDVLVVAVVVHLATAVRWTASVVLLVTGSLGLVAYDVAFRLGRIRGEWLAGTAIDIGWLWFFAALGAAALVPSMRSFDVPLTINGPANGRDPRLRLSVVGVAALMPSAVLLIGSFDTPSWMQPLIVGAATLVLILAFIRVLDVASQLRGQVRGERVTREAIAELADAHDAATVTAVLDKAIGRLLKPGADYRATVATTPHGPSGVTADAPVGEPREVATAPAPASGGSRRHRVTYAVALDQPADGDEQRVLDGRRVALIRGDRPALDRIRPRLTVLATQAGLALERLRLNEEIIRHTSEAYFRALVQNSADVILILDDADRIRYASPSAASIFGPVALHGIPLTALLDREDRSAAARLLERARAGADAAGDWTVHAAGQVPIQVEATCRDLRTDPSIDGLVVTLRDVTAQRGLELELAQRAFQDPLTGLPNRLPFSERLDAAVRASVTYSRLAGVLFVDLDDLKMINDGYGHEVGDAILRRVGERLLAFVAAEGDAGPVMAARLGGDEFAVLLAGAADEDSITAAASRLVATLARPVHVGENEIVCATSVGVATTADASTAQELLRNADIALYAAKGAGKRQWRRYEPWMSSTLIARLELRTALERAIEEDEFFLEYQPVVALDGDRTVGFEALLRWRHPTRGRLGPEQFIDVAEESGLITSIGEWVLATAFRAAQRWDGAPNESPYIAVNVSARQFRSPGFLRVFRRLLADSGLRPHRVMVEITESLLLREDDSVWTDLQQLRRSGVVVAIDDFGTGYSALSYLRQVPLDVVKLDRSFIKTISTSPKQRELVRGIVGLAQILDLQVIAEGIETEPECVAATRVGCRYGQGFLFGAPMPEPEISGWLRDASRQPIG